MSKTTSPREASGPGPSLSENAPLAVELRRKLQDLVVRDLLGPAGGPEEEIDEQRVRERYLIGMLAPKKQRVAAAETDALEVAEEDLEEGPIEPSTLAHDSLFPSSFGLSFSVPSEIRELRVTASWGWYQRVESEMLITDKSDPKLIWRRRPMRGVWVMPISAGLIGPWRLHDDQPEVLLRGQIRRRGDNWIITLFLVNDQDEPKQLVDEAWLFQAELSVDSPDGRAVFRRGLAGAMLGAESSNVDAITRAEGQAHAMLYRDQVEFAAGHGVSVHWERAPGDPTRAVRICTSAAPVYEVAQRTSPGAEDNAELQGLELDMKVLADAQASDLPALLKALPDAYKNWIAREEARLVDPAGGLQAHEDAGRAALERCARGHERINEGLELLARSAQAAEAFQFANRAMWLQRTRSLYSEAVRRGEDVTAEQFDVARNRTWRPFQLAFILLNLPGVADPHHKDRQEIADLLWFPTGGGKTEAYLGLAAFTLAMRRLQGPVGGRAGESGLAVLMRYTLRLLTLQQFQRAAALICACEAIRREAIARGDARWGAEPFRLGLWVGMKTTPNSVEQSAESLQSFRRQGFSGASRSGSPAQLIRCPWCGASIEAGRDLHVEKYPGGRARTFTYCGDGLGQCLFSKRQAPDEGLPVVVVDEEIYRRLPSMMISTVDKFAQMPWKGAVGTLFGQVNGRCPRHGFMAPEIEDAQIHPAGRSNGGARAVEHAPLRPPDLIIQDELHLISGPLGSLVGLYETAVDELCSWELDGRKIRPKIVASTATIRRAGEQVQSLFDRRVEVFPPHGLNSDDDFFSLRREPSEDCPGRLYLGICAPGRRFKGVLIRVYLAYLSAAQHLYQQYGSAVDPWMTLLGYFNSMRELGGMRRLVDDDIRARLDRMDERGLAKRRRPITQELTSRISAGQIPTILDLLEARFDPGEEQQRREQRKSNQPVTTKDPIDVVLATNMISVGVDVKRLGLMVVTGQPKATAEYIQATSRVGRGVPGVVCTIFNWARPRDLSHYEKFEHYHATFYQHVEALSVTPFAARARDRALGALLVSLIRLCGAEYNEDSKAGRLDREHPAVRRAINSITERAAHVTGSKDAAAQVRQELEMRVDQWLQRARRPAGAGSLHYRPAKGDVAVGLLRRPGLNGWDPFTCLNSLREVEPQVQLILDDVWPDEEPPDVGSPAIAGAVDSTE